MKNKARRTTLSQKCSAIGIALGYLALFFAARIAVEFPIGFVYGIYIAFTADLSGDAAIEALYGGTVAYDLTMICVIFGNALFMLACLVLMSVRRKSFVNEVGWHKIKGDGRLLAFLTAPTALGFVLSILCTVAISVAVSLYPPLSDALERFSNETTIFEEANTTLSFIATVIAAPIAEELVFRGLIYTRLRRACSYLSSILITGLLFGLAHGTLIHMLYTVPLSILLCVFYDRYRSLWAPILLHFGFNAAGTAMMYFVHIPYWFIGVCFAVAAFGIIMLCLYKTDVKKEIWDIAMELPRKRAFAPPPHFAQSTAYPHTAPIIPTTSDPVVQNRISMQNAAPIQGDIPVQPHTDTDAQVHMHAQSTVTAETDVATPCNKGGDNP